jgi:hypothetical protein
MKKLLLAAGVLTLALGVGVADDAALKSGPQVGSQVPGPFHPRNITGAFKGEKHCLFCEHGNCPVAMVFAREVTPELTKLIKKIDAATVKNSKARMGSFVVFLSDKEGLAGQLESLAAKEKIAQTVLAIDNPGGPQRYAVAKDADITVVLYEDHTVRANHSFRKGELNTKAADRIVADIAKIVTPN